MNFKIFTFGCKVNQYETEYIRKIMCESGYISTENDSEAQIFIVNSCAVTAVSESKCRRFIGRLRRNYPESIIVLCGCMSQAFPRKYENFSPCDIVIGNGVHTEIPNLIKRLEETGEKIIEILPHDRKNEAFEPCLISDFSERTRAYLKIEDGCDRFCSYCIIPYSRGRVRSKPLEDIKNEVDVLSKAGFEEIVLVGINLSKYGTDLGLSLWDAVSTVADCEKVKRIRLGSLEPELLTREILENLSKCEKFCPQFHLSLQSGCNSTLKRMNRHYSSCEYREIVENIRSLFENPSFTTDVMVGFPGEDEAEFEDSLSFVTSIGFAKVHVFPYSRRSGTVADRMDNQLSKAVKDERAKLMIKACEEKRLEFLKSQVGTETEVLFERPINSEFIEGYSQNYTPVKVKGDKGLCHTCQKVKITSVETDYCIGELI